MLASTISCIRCLIRVTSSSPVGASNLQIAVITFGYRMFHKQFSLGKEFRDSFKQDKAKRTDISTHTGGSQYIQKLYILIIIYSVIESFVLCY